MQQRFVELGMKIDNPEGFIERFIGTSHAANLLGISVGTVHALVKKDELRAWVTGGGHRRVSMQSILDYQKQHNLTTRSTPPVPQARLRVLVVENDAATREIFMGLAARWALPIDFVVMASGMEALIDISALRPDVLVTDLEMQGMDGFQLLRALRANPAFAETFLLALTGLSQREVAERGGLPVDSVQLGRPLDMSWLHGYFVALLSTRQRRTSTN